MFESAGQLSKAMKLLEQRWAQTRDAWNDAVSERFEAQFLVPWRLELRQAMAAMDEMAALLAKIRKDCMES